MKKFSVLAILIILTGLSCERDDICSENTPTTPSLVIRFYNVDDQEQTKQVRLLTVNGIDSEGNPLDDIVSSISTDSIVLPLRFQNEGVITTSRFQLIKDSDFDSDTNPNTFSNTDVIEVSYTPQFIYVSRACGYKSIFNNLQNTLIIDPDNWIFGYNIINSTLENENTAHIILYH